MLSQQLNYATEYGCNSLKTLEKGPFNVEHRDRRYHPTTLHHRSPHSTTPYHTPPHLTTLHHSTPHSTTLHHTSPHSTTPHHTPPRPTTPHHSQYWCRCLSRGSPPAPPSPSSLGGPTGCIPASPQLPPASLGGVQWGPGSGDMVIGLLKSLARILIVSLQMTSLNIGT